MTAYTLITGASSGIGAATAVKLAGLGHNLILTARRKGKLQELKTKIKEKYEVSVIVEPLDVTDAQAVVDLAKKYADVPLRGLINNAGLALGRDTFQKSDLKDLETMIAVNITGFTRVAHAFWPCLRADSTFVAISSIAATMAYRGAHVYGASKAFVRQFCANLRLDALGTGVRVVEIAPGKTETEFSVVRYKGDQEKAAADYKNYQPLTATDIAEAIGYAFSAPAHVNIDTLMVQTRDWARPGFGVSSDYA